MIKLPQLKALAKEHKLRYSYMNKGEIINLLIEKQIITPADLLQLKTEKEKDRGEVTEFN